MESLSGKLSHLQSGQYIAFNWECCGTSLRVAILDSLSDRDARFPLAALLVPRGKEREWVFSSQSGHWQLLSSASAARLVVLRRVKDDDADVLQGGEGGGFGVEVSLRGSVVSGRQQQGRDQDFGEGEGKNIGSGWQGLQGDRLAFGGVASNSEAVLGGRLSSCDWVSGDERCICKNVRRNGPANELDDEILKEELSPFLAAFAPEFLSTAGLVAVPFVSYDDNVLRRVIVEEAYSPLIGRIVVEDVELLDESRSAGHRIFEDGCHRHKTKLRRRLRFQRMPNMIQTEVSIVMAKKGQVGISKDSSDDKDMEARVDHINLVHKYLAPVVAGLVLAAPSLEACIASHKKVRVLSIGVGGGALPMFLHERLGFHVEAVDLDETVLRLARCHFGLVEEECLQVKVGDGVEVISDIANQAISMHLVASELVAKWQELSGDLKERWLDSSSIMNMSACRKCQTDKRSFDSRMNVIIVDVDAEDARLGLSSPPMAFLEKGFLLGVQIALQEGGMLVFNVVSFGERPYKCVTNALRHFFEGLYEITLGDDENHVVFAFPKKIGRIDLDSSFACRIKSVIDEHLIYQITEVFE
eukprot:c24626_g1_i1 orf=102-1856(-)